ncbi:MAG: EI24 domain-containing protein [Lentisphaeria bacterium]|nr:EI24 domain-containing protein [Lentisphaeria bacterium]
MWKFGIIPLGLMLIFYALAIFGVYSLSGFVSGKLAALTGQLPDWLVWVGSVLNSGVVIFSVLFFVFFLSTSIGTFYEFFGGLFFDALTQHYENRRFGIVPCKMTFAGNFKYALNSLFWGIRVVIIFCLLFIVSLFFPIAGQIVLIAAMGYCFGVSYMICSAQNNGVSLAELQQLCSQRRVLVMGFGTAAYLLLSIPAAAIFFLPALVIGGSELFNEQLKNRIS